MKVFCIGKNKTGTTSMCVVFEMLGLKLGNQRKGELLLDDYLNNDFKPFCQKKILSLHILS